MQWLKATVPVQRVWLPTPACVIVAACAWARHLKARTSKWKYTVLKIFSPFRIFEQLALDLKNRVALKFFTVLKYLLSFRIFEQLALALKTEFAWNFLSLGSCRPPHPRLVHLWRIMFWILICASSWWCHSSSQMSREWKVGCSTKLTVYGSCRGGLFIVLWLFEKCRDKVFWSLSIFQSCLFQLLRCDDNLTEN